MEIGNLPAFPVSDDRVKLSAAWLIERAGIQRGYVHGNVGTSTKHALAVINRGGGTAVEVIELMELIQKRVLERFGVVLLRNPFLWDSNGRPVLGARWYPARRPRIELTGRLVC